MHTCKTVLSSCVHRLPPESGAGKCLHGRLKHGRSLTSFNKCAIVNFAKSELFILDARIASHIHFRHFIRDLVPKITHTAWVSSYFHKPDDLEFQNCVKHPFSVYHHRCSLDFRYLRKPEVAIVCYKMPLNILFRHSLIGVVLKTTICFELFP